MSHGLLQSFSPVLSSPGFHGCPDIGRDGGLYPRRSRSGGGNYLFYPYGVRRGNSFRFLRPALSRGSAERTRFLLSVEKGIVVS